MTDNSDKQYLELECKSCHTEFEVREDKIPFFCPVCMRKVDLSCEINYEREENKE